MIHASEPIGSEAIMVWFVGAARGVVREFLWVHGGTNGLQDHEYDGDGF